MTDHRIVKAAKENAGVFYDQDRSALFRQTWPDQDVYVQAKWPHFVASVREGWSGALGDPSTPQAVKDYFYDALVADRVQEAASSPAQNDVVQLAPGTNQFHGDKFENRETAKNFGNGGWLHRKLMTTAAKFKL